MADDKKRLIEEARQSEESKNNLFESWIVDSTTDQEPSYEYSEGESRED